MNDFIVHLDDYGKTLKGMTNEEVGELIKALIGHIEGEEIEIKSPTVSAVYPIMSGRVDRDLAYRQKASEYGKKGGAPFGNTNAKNKGKTRVKQGLDKAKQTPNPNPNPNPIIKKTYGECENVKLTDDEYQKLKDKNLTHLIDELSLYIASKGDKYKSHYATILGWSRKREKESSPKVNQFTSGAKGADYDFEEILKRKVVN